MVVNTICCVDELLVVSAPAPADEEAAAAWPEDVEVNVALEVLTSVVAEGDEAAVAFPVVVPPTLFAELCAGAEGEEGGAWLVRLAWLEGEGEGEVGAGVEEPGGGEEFTLCTGAEL